MTTRRCIGFAFLALALTKTARAQRGIPRFPIPDSPIAIEGSARPGVYLADVGRRAALFADETGRIEAWTWPLKLVRDLSFAFKIPDYDAPIEAERIAKRVIVRPAVKTIVYSHPTFTVRAHLITPLDEPGALVLLDVESIRPLEILVRMNADFNLAWPGGFGGQHIGWEPDRNLFLLTQGGVWAINAAVGSPAATTGTSHPAHDAPAFPSQFTIAVDTALARTQFLPIVIAGGMMPRDSLWPIYDRLVARARDYVDEKTAHYRRIQDSLVSIESPDSELNQAFEWAKVNLDRQRVCNPDLGCGLVAGFGKAGAGNFRPGFGWYFGGDAAINSFAMDLVGQFDLVREGLTFLGGFQRADGKIPHEISHSAKRLPWWTDYPYTWYHGDTTPFWILAAAEYWRASADSAWIDSVWDKLVLAYRWSKGTDTDGDGLMENPAAGAGAIEVGGLGDNLHTDIYLAGVWVSALEGLADLARARGQSQLLGEVSEWRDRARKSLETRFWMDRVGRYAFALLESRTGRIELNDALTVWPTTAIAFGQLDPDRSRRMLEEVASDALTTDWGVRMLSRFHPLYEALHYNNGAVWPFVTGFASLGHYRTHRAWAGYDLVRDVAQTTFDFARGVQPELLSGAFYEPLDTAVPDQFFATSMMVTPILKGLLGMRPDAPHCRLGLAPQLPADWDRFTVRHLPVGCVAVTAAIERGPGQLSVALEPEHPFRGRAVPRVLLAPALPLGARVTGVSIDGRSVRFETETSPHDVAARVEVPVDRARRIAFRYQGGAEIVPANHRPMLGDPVRGLRILDWRLENDRYLASVEGSPGVEYRLRIRTGLPLRVVEGGRLEGRRGDLLTIALTMPSGGTRPLRHRVVLAP